MGVYTILNLFHAHLCTSISGKIKILKTVDREKLGVSTLGVNIDHIATIRQARRTVEPDPVAAAVLAELGGADGITVHLREDRRHIQDRDVRLLRQTVRTHLRPRCAAFTTNRENSLKFRNGRYR